MEQIDYIPQADYRYGVELIPSQSLWARGSDDHFQQPQRLQIFLALVVEDGCMHHRVDFVDYTVMPGEWLLIQPGQVQQFDRSKAWRGWFLPILPEFLKPEGAELLLGLHQLPVHLRPAPSDQAHCLQVVYTMASDSQRDGGSGWRNMLLRHQLCEVLLRMILSCQSPPEAPHLQPSAAKMVARFRDAIEQGFRQHHALSHYAQRLGYSERTLARNCLAVTGTSAKQLLDERIVLEAKRLLTHTAMAANAIALELGFDDASNFVKFFSRKTGQPPGAFRRNQS